jgi:hypothetical protein
MGILNSTVGVIAAQVFRANGLFDPDLTGAGHQPYGFDQMVAYYGRWQVVKSRMDVEICGFTTFEAVCATISSEAAVVSTLNTIDLLTEPGRGQTVITSYNAAPTRTVSSEWDMKALYPDHDPGDFEGTSAADPTRVDYHTLAFQPVDGVSTSQLYYLAVVTYEVVWKDPVTIVPS